MPAGLASVPTWVRSPACVRKLGQVNSGAYCYRINILGSQLSPNSINLVPAQAGKVTVRSGVALAIRHRHHGLSIYGLNSQRQGDEHPRLCPFGTLHHLPYHHYHLYFLFMSIVPIFQQNTPGLAGSTQRFPKELLLIADARFLRVGIPSSHSTNSVKTLNGPQ